MGNAGVQPRNTSDEKSIKITPYIIVRGLFYKEYQRKVHLRGGVVVGRWGDLLSCEADHIFLASNLSLLHSL